MDSKKIGVFIKDLRTGKGMSQKQLAEMLNVTDKAVSKWETGRGVPDISLLEPLSTALGISLSELMNGEKTSAEDDNIKSNEAIRNTIDCSNKEIKRSKKNTLIFGTAGFLLVLSFLFLRDDSSWKCIYSIIALLILCAGVFRTCDKNRAFKAILTFIIGMCLFNLMDINNVINFHKPPIYVYSIETKDTTVVYKSIFYNVYRYNRDSDKEYYYISFFKTSSTPAITVSAMESSFAPSLLVVPVFLEINPSITSLRPQIIYIT